MDPLSCKSLWRLPEKGVHRRGDVSEAPIPPKLKPNLWQLLCLHAHSSAHFPAGWGRGGILQAKIPADAFSSARYYNFLEELGMRGRGQAGGGHQCAGMSVRISTSCPLPLPPLLS